MLRRAGLDLGVVLEAGDGVEALEKLRDQPVGLILSDINMPNMDGIQLLRVLKSSDKFKHVPVVMITTETGEAKVMEALRLGASGYIRKPFTADQIKDRLAGLF